MRTISQSRTGKIISAYIILNRDGKMIANIHTHFITDCLQVDIYDQDSILCYQNRVKSPDLSTAIGYGECTSGAVIDGVKLYQNGVGIDPKDKSLIKTKELTHYLPGLDRLKAMGYNVIKVI